MEAAELWHAEHITKPLQLASYDEMRREHRVAGSGPAPARRQRQLCARHAPALDRGQRSHGRRAGLGSLRAGQRELHRAPSGRQRLLSGHTPTASPRGTIRWRRSATASARWWSATPPPCGGSPRRAPTAATIDPPDRDRSRLPVGAGPAARGRRRRADLGHDQRRGRRQLLLPGHGPERRVRRPGVRQRLPPGPGGRAAARAHRGGAGAHHLHLRHPRRLSRRRLGRRTIAAGAVARSAATSTRRRCPARPSKACRRSARRRSTATSPGCWTRLRAVGIEQVIAVDLGKAAIGPARGARRRAGPRRPERGRRRLHARAARAAADRRHGMSTCVFLGPTLPTAEVAGILDATCLPPVQLGDVYRVVARHRPRAIGIVDGYFQWAPAVWHKEILWAICQGVHVFGAASMGALRAAELAPFGMQGVGRIFEAYRDGSLGRRALRGRRRGGGRARTAGKRLSRRVRGDGEHPLHAGPGGERRGDRRGDPALPRRRTPRRPSSPIAAMRPCLRRDARTRLPEAEIAALARWLPHGRVEPEAPRRGGDARGDARFHRRRPAARPGELHLRAHDLLGERRGEVSVAADRPRRPLLAALRLDASRCERVGEDELRDWYFARVAGTAVPADLDGWTREAGFADAGDFHRAAFAEYLVHGLADEARAGRRARR